MYNKFIVMIIFTVTILPNCSVFSYEQPSFVDDEMEAYLREKGNADLGTAFPLDLNNPEQVARIIFFEGEIHYETAIYLFRRQNYSLRAKVDEYYKIHLNGGNSLIPDDYLPFAESSAKDVLFALLHGPIETKQRHAKTLVCSPNYVWETILMEILVVEDTNRAHFIEELKKVPPSPNRTFDDCLSENYKDDYKHFLSGLSKKNRDTKIDQPHDEEVKRAVDKLNKERKGSSAVRKGWKFKRSVLDDYLMSKPTKLVQDILASYAEQNSKHQLRDDIPKKIDDKNVILGYQILIDFIQNPYTYMARRIHDSVLDVNGNFQETLILFGVCNSETPELGKIAKAFEDLYDKTPLKTFLENECLDDAVCDTVRLLLP